MLGVTQQQIQQVVLWIGKRDFLLNVAWKKYKSLWNVLSVARFLEKYVSVLHGTCALRWHYTAFPWEDVYNHPPSIKLAANVAVKVSFGDREIIWTPENAEAHFILLRSKGFTASVWKYWYSFTEVFNTEELNVSLHL